MTIKDIEIESGMTRANIRFYEAEGLLNPERRENGYREYSEKDLEILKRIKLLRALHISLEEIKCLHNGDKTLVDVLDQHLLNLQSEKTNIEQAQKICTVMRNDGAQYQTLNAQRYMDTLERSTSEPVSTPSSDILPEPNIPWRRYFARILDYVVYEALWRSFLALALNINIYSRSAAGNALDSIVVLVILFIAEPILLTLFGTTPGKWVLGIRVTDNEGELLTYESARARTWSVMFRGVGLMIPFIRQYRQWQSYKAKKDGETLDWEYNSAITLKDDRPWRIFAYLGVYAALTGMMYLSSEIAEMPKNRGDITVAEFCQNYNRLAKYYGYGTDIYLDEQGNWKRNDHLGYVTYMGYQYDPRFVFEETDGIMTGMHFTAYLQDSPEIIKSYFFEEKMILSILAFAGAQEENWLLSNQMDKIVEDISQSHFTNYQYNIYGVNVTCEIDYTGYTKINMGILWPEDDTESRFTLTFSMQK